MDAINMKLEELLPKGSKIGNQQAKDASNLLFALYDATHNADQLADYLMKFHLSVCRNFFEGSVSHIPENDIDAIIAALINNSRFKENKSDCALYRGFIIIGITLNTERSYESTVLLLNRLLMIAEKPEGFSPRSLEIFKERAYVDCGVKIFLIDTTPWKEFERRRFQRFLITFINSETFDANIPEVIAWVESTGARLPRDTSSFSETKYKKESVIDVNPKERNLKISETAHAEKPISSPSLGPANELLKTIKAANQEALDLLVTLTERHGTITTLKQSLTEKEEEIVRLRSDVKDRENQVASLCFTVSQKDNLLREQQTITKDLSDRLKASFQMDDISRSQELITLKKDIAEALRLEYEDFNESKNNSCDDDIFEAYKASLTRIFRTLKRFGISLD